MTTKPFEATHDLAATVAAAQDGDEEAWAILVRRFDRLLRRIGQRYRLTAGDVDDVAQATWLRAYANLHTLRQPAAFAAWLAMTARREALCRLQGPTRELLTDDPGLFEHGTEASPETLAIDADRREILQRAMSTLPERHRELMLMIASSDSPDYQTISERLDMPIGSIGPIRGRCLQRLQRHAELRALVA
jgi:RNA polymerase sigma factor (sigma-70 family)